jgi:hypothetical protein
VLAAIPLVAVALVTAATSRADGSRVTVTLSPRSSVIVVPDKGCVSAHVSLDGAALPDAVVFAAAPGVDGPHDSGLDASSSPTDARGNAQVCFQVTTPSFSGGDRTYSARAYMVNSPKAGLFYPVVSNTVTVVVKNPTDVLPPIKPPTALYSLAVRSSIAQTAVRIGDPLTFSATVTNNGFLSAEGLRFQVEGTDLTLGTPAVEVATLTSPSAVCSVTELACTIDALAPGASMTMTLTGRTATTLRPIELTAYASGAQTNATSTSTITAGPDTTDLATMLSPRLSATLGKPVTIPIIIRNNGPDVQIDTRVTPKLPAGLVVVSCQEFGTLCAKRLAAGNVFSLGDIEPGGQVATTITVRSTFARTFTIPITPTPSTNYVDRDPTNNTAATTLVVKKPPIKRKKRTKR